MHSRVAVCFAFLLFVQASAQQQQRCAKASDAVDKAEAEEHLARDAAERARSWVGHFSIEGQNAAVLAAHVKHNNARRQLWSAQMWESACYKGSSFLWAFRTLFFLSFTMSLGIAIRFSVWAIRDLDACTRQICQYQSQLKDASLALSFQFRPDDFQKQVIAKGIGLETYKLMFLPERIQCEEEVLLLKRDFVEQSHIRREVEKTNLLAWMAELSARDKKVFRVVVAGETSDGKSTIINNLVGGDVTPAADNAQGTTKKVTGYTVRKPWVGAGIKLQVYDIPGWGDSEVSAPSVLQMLMDEQERNNKPFDALILCMRADSGSLKFGPKMVAQMVKVAFQGVPDEKRWKCVALVGSQRDRCQRDQEAAFSRDILPLLNKSINRGKSTPTDIEHVCTVDCKPLGDYSKSPGLDPLRKVLSNMMDKIIEEGLDLKMSENEEERSKQLESLQFMDRGDALAAISDVNIGKASNEEDCIQELAMFAAGTPGSGDDDKDNIYNKWVKQQEDLKVQQALLKAKAEELEKEKIELEAQKEEKKKKELEEMAAREAQRLAAANEEQRKAAESAKWLGKRVLYTPSVSYWSTLNRYFYIGGGNIMSEGYIELADESLDVYQLLLEDGKTIQTKRNGFKVFDLDLLAIPVQVGPHNMISGYTKTVPAPEDAAYIQPDAGDFENRLNREGRIPCRNHKYAIQLNGRSIQVTRTDKPAGWANDLWIECWVLRNTEEPCPKKART